MYAFGCVFAGLAGVVSFWLLFLHVVVGLAGLAGFVSFGGFWVCFWWSGESSWCCVIWDAFWWVLKGRARKLKHTRFSIQQL